MSLERPQSPLMFRFLFDTIKSLVDYAKDEMSLNPPADWCYEIKEETMEDMRDGSELRIGPRAPICVPVDLHKRFGLGIVVPDHNSYHKIHILSQPSVYGGREEFHATCSQGSVVWGSTFVGEYPSELCEVKMQIVDNNIRLELVSEEAREKAQRPVLALLAAAVLFFGLSKMVDSLSSAT